MSTQATIVWPEPFRSNDFPVLARNELDMQATLERVWVWLVRAPLWPTWYKHSADLKILEGPTPDLTKRTRFHWKTLGLPITSTVLDEVRHERIAWDAHVIGFHACHAWRLRPSEKGCYVLSEEKQYGFLARLNKLLRPQITRKIHQIWLESLEGQARLGLPPMPGS